MTSDPPPERPMPSVVGTERTKLSATFLDTVAVAITGTGLVAPFFASLYGLSTLSADQIRFFALAAPGWDILRMGLHLVARAVRCGLGE
ncbi:MAG: hypothetical protein K2X71_06155 [Methylobacterium sp.]|uniref:hypothetical protein n=1 Tax=Methylobacterium sp. TaxID=409 RepID=UPI00258BA139|nr:hypothetical protein [Methylobacterium sp.]MBY0295607.1 hypothetical protein [Methylobacterium sp.]